MLAAALFVAASCGPSATETAGDHRNVLLITVDTLRADALGFAGNAEVETPALDRLARSGRVFTSAHAHAVTTLPSHASILTGLHPHEHGVRHNGGFVLSGDVPTLATRLQSRGFATAAFVGAFPLDARFGLDRGFDVYDDELEGDDSVFLYAERPGSEVVERAHAWWREHAGERRFLWIHLFDPHAPYEPPEPYAGRFRDAPYLGEVSAVDGFLAAWLGDFLDGREDPTLVVFTSDHGESLGEHGELTHGLFAYEATLAVPLVLWGDGVAAGVDRRPARHVDLLPTILEALGEPVPGALPGTSLLAPAGDHPDLTYFEALSANLDFGWAPLRGVIRDGEKYIDLPLRELYDLESDPREQTNLFEERRRRASELAGTLPEESAWPPAAGAISADEAARLRSLGYLSGGATAGGERVYTPEDDLKNLVGLDRKVARLADLSLRGERGAAIRLGHEILAERPDMGLVYVYLSTLLVEAGEHVEAIRVLGQAREHGVAGRELLRQLGLSLLTTGRPGDALEVLEPLAEDPSDLEARNHLALAYAYLGRESESLALLEDLAARAPAEPRTHENLAFVAIRQGRFEDARQHAERALALDAELASSWSNLGIALYALSRPADAVDAWQRALELRPRDFDTLLNLAVAAEQLGRVELARESLERFAAEAPSPAYDAKRRQARELLKALGG